MRTAASYGPNGNGKPAIRIGTQSDGPSAGGRTEAVGGLDVATGATSDKRSTLVTVPPTKLIILQIVTLAWRKLGLGCNKTRGWLHDFTSNRNSDYLRG